MSVGHHRLHRKIVKFVFFVLCDIYCIICLIGMFLLYYSKYNSTVYNITSHLNIFKKHFFIFKVLTLLVIPHVSISSFKFFAISH